VQSSPSGPEECDIGKDNGNTSITTNPCNIGCMRPHYCGDGNVDTAPPLNEECDLGSNNGKAGQPCDGACHYIVF
jgi:hypothetical protein